MSIKNGDFYNVHNTIDDNSLDVLHIDIANNGDVIQFTFDNYIQKLKHDGVLIIEGGSIERDNVEWMLKYNKPQINSVLQQYKTKYKIITIGDIPSITLIKRF